MSVCVSIIIPIYNSDEFLDDTIRSIVRQNYPDWELILVDDGSTDDSVAICEKYTTNEKIQLIKQQNSGVSVARNRGLSLAKGKWIYFLDSDDTIDKDFLITSVEIAKKENSDIVVVGNYFKRRFPNVFALPTCAMFIKHSFLKQYPEIRFPEGIQPCEDGLFSHQLLALTNKIGFNPKGIYHYRKHNNQNHQTINANPQKVLNQIPLWLNILENFYKKYDLFKQKSLHLALFIQHEPFGQRYLKMPLSELQKEFLFQLIKSFINKNATPFLKKRDWKALSPLFVKFLEFNNPTLFDDYLPLYVDKIERERNTRLKIAKFIYFGKKQKRKLHRINVLFDNKLDL